MPPSLDSRPKCEDCSRLDRRVRRDTDLAYQRTVTRELLRSLEQGNLIDRDAKVCHEVDEDDVIGFYDFDTTTEFERCSYDNWRHWHGVLLYTRCGKLQQNGLDCASTYLEGIERAVVYHRVRLLIDTLQQEQQWQPAEILGRAHVVADRARRTLEGRRALQQWAPQFEQPLATAIQNRHAYVEQDATRWDEVRGQHVPEYRRYELVGQELFERGCAEGVFREATVAQAVDAAEDYARWMSTLQIHHGNYLEVQSRRDLVQQAITHLERLIEKAERFWATELNLQAACEIVRSATGASPAKVHGTCFKVSGKVIGAHGLVAEESAPSSDRRPRSVRR